MLNKVGRFDEWGDDAEDRHVTEFENDDLTIPELRLKITCLEEDGSDNEIEIARQDLAARGIHLSR